MKMTTDNFYRYVLGKRDPSPRVDRVSFDFIYNKLEELGIYLTEVSCDPWDDHYEIRARIPKTSIFKPTVMTSKSLKPKKVIFSGPATTILWTDGTKTTVRCQAPDDWTPDVGIAMCYLKKIFGNQGNFNNIFREARKVADVR